MTSLPTWRGWLVICALALVLGWLLAPSAPAPVELIKARRDDWQLAPLPRRLDQTSLAANAFAASYWGAAAATPASVTEAPPPDTRWRIAAVFGSGGDAGAMLVFEAVGKPPQIVRRGDELPGGYKIESIGERDVCVRVGKKVYRLGVERREK